MSPQGTNAMQDTRLVGLVVFLAGLFAAPSADAIIFRVGEPSEKTFDVVNLANIPTAGFFNTAGEFQESPGSIGVMGTITLGKRPGPPIPSRPEGDLNAVAPGATVPIDLLDILDFELVLDVTTPTGQTARVPANRDTAFFAIIGDVLRTDGQSVLLDSAGVTPGFPLIDITVDRFPDKSGFPNGERFGDGDDFILAQLFRGSVNLGVGYIPDGVVEATAVAQLTPGDSLVIAEFGVVPEPTAAVFALLAVATASACRVRSPSQTARR